MPGVGQVAVGALSNGSRFDDYGESDDDLHSENIMFLGEPSHIGKFLKEACDFYLILLCSAQ